MSKSKAQRILDEVGNGISGEVREWILSIDRLEKENRSLREKLGKQARQEQKPHDRENVKPKPKPEPEPAEPEGGSKEE